VVRAPTLIPLLAPLVGGVGVLVWRLQETRTPVTTAKIVIPPLGMSTGMFMFLSPAMRVPWSWLASAFLVGALLLAVPLARTSVLERRGDVVWMRRSNGFYVILLGILAARLLLHEWVGDFLSPLQSAALLYVLAFGMVLRWRAGMYLRYGRLVRVGPTGHEKA
jgi:membrane protein CcdC involved in cytochrome C biogenesis